MNKKSYVNDSLVKDEKIIYEAKVSIWSLAPLLILGLALLPFYIGPIFWIIAAIQYRTTELAITNKRVIAKFGFISRSTIETSLQKIETIQVKQDILGRIFNYGSIVLSGSGNPQTPIPGISNPLQFRRVFVESQEEESQAK